MDSKAVILLPPSLLGLPPYQELLLVGMTPPGILEEHGGTGADNITGLGTVITVSR